MIGETGLTYPEASVIGGGIAGLTTALELQGRGFDVTLYDPRIPDDLNISSETVINASTVATAQFLPFIQGNTSREAYSQSVEEVQKMAKISHGVYEELAENPEVTGVMRIVNVEPVNSVEDWPEYLPKLMSAVKREIPEPITLEGPDGQPTVWTDYYEFGTFSINSPKTHRFLLRHFKEQGGKIRSDLITRQALINLGHPVVQATGAYASELANDESTKRVKGVTITYSPDRPIPPVAISVDDLIIMPREDGNFCIGALLLDKPDSTVAEKEELEGLERRVRALAQINLGPFESLPDSAFDNPISYRAGQRLVPAKGITIVRDATQPNIVHNYGYGGIGWSTAFGYATKVADLVEH